LADQPLFFVGNQEPSITETLTDEAGLPIDLSADSAKFKMRPLGSTTLKVDAAVSNTPGVDGVVRYDWSINDVDTPGQFLVWWEITNAAGRNAGPRGSADRVPRPRALSNGYIELEELKSSTELTSTSFADQDLQNAIVAASRSIDLATGRRFYPDTDALQVRYYTPTEYSLLHIDDLITLTSVETDINDDGVTDYTWTQGTDFILEPRNALADGYPYTGIRRLRYGNYCWPTYTDSVKVTGRFGWAAVPANIKVATTILAARFVKRMREAPFGVAGFDAAGATVRISQTDPDVMNLVAPYVRRVLFANQPWQP
jgi:hypothetical protein